MTELKPNISVGSLLLNAGKLKLQDIELIQHCQKEQGLCFGEAAVKLGFVAEVDIQQVLAQQFNYPYLKAGEEGFSEDLVAAYQPFSPHVETLRGLRSQLRLRWFNEENKQLAVVGSGSRVGCSYLTANLAIVFSQLGARTLLVDANLRNPCQHKLFNLTKRQGLSEVLAGRIGMEAISKIPSFADLYILPAGALPPNPQELLGQPAFRFLLREFTKNYDVTLLDTPNGLVYADMQNIVAETGAALLVMHKNQTLLSDANAIKVQVSNAKAQIVGVVLNEF